MERVEFTEPGPIGPTPYDLFKLSSVEEVSQCYFHGKAYE